MPAFLVCGSNGKALFTRGISERDVGHDFFSRRLLGGYRSPPSTHTHATMRIISYQGGAIVMSSGNSWDTDPGGVVTLEKSTFANNIAAGESAGVISLGKFTTVVIAGDRNTFTGNSCGVKGGVLGGTKDTNVIVEGGSFTRNSAGEVRREVLLIFTISPSALVHIFCVYM